ncbi:MAG: hypothetical protein PHI55_07635 [Burkholderiaceae bacterium]|nr:hypothetical protein [Burkholderiaceae bacterium]
MNSIKLNQLLIVEDSEAKLASILAAVSKIIPIDKIKCSRSVKSALKALKQEDFSIIIADMSLPTYDVKAGERGGTPRPFGGIEIFDHLQRAGKKTSVAVVSSYPAIVEGNTSLTLHALSEKLAIDYPDNFCGYVFFDSTYLIWEVELLEIIRIFFKS